MTDDEPDILVDFYRKNPFPGIERMRTELDLRRAAFANPFLQYLDNLIDDDARVLEIGCGTGHVSHYLALKDSRTVLGCDISEQSLKYAADFTRRTNGDNCQFVNSSLSDLPIKDRHDVVLALGVLHHLDQPYSGFTEALDHLKPGGLIIIGLYNTFGRVQTKIRGKLFRGNDKVLRVLDPRLRTQEITESEASSWIADQYEHPREMSYTIKQAISWFERSHVRLLRVLPEQGIPEADAYYEETGTSWYTRSRAQFKILFNPGKDGGYMVLIGQKRGAACS